MRLKAKYPVLLTQLALLLALTVSTNLASTNLASTNLTAVGNKRPSISNLVRKTDYKTKISETEKKILIMIMINILLLQNLIS